MIAKLCPQFVADTVNRVANDHDPVQFKRPDRSLSEQQSTCQCAQPAGGAATNAIVAHSSQDWPPIPANENGLVTVREAEQMLRCCKTTVHTLINTGKLERVKVGRATRITVRSIRAITGVL
jgi:hypothetical protein